MLQSRAVRVLSITRDQLLPSSPRVYRESPSAILGLNTMLQIRVVRVSFMMSDGVRSPLVYHGNLPRFSDWTPRYSVERCVYRL